MIRKVLKSQKKKVLIALAGLVFFLSGSIEKSLGFDGAAGGCVSESLCPYLKEEYEKRQKYLLREEIERYKMKEKQDMLPPAQSQGVNYPPPPSSSPISSKKKQLEKDSSYMYKKYVDKANVAEKIASLPVEIYPEKTVWIELSNTDVNRIVCVNGKIGNIFFSQEKGMIVKISGNEAYIKFKSLLDPLTNKITRITTPAEFYIRCAGKTYSFIAKPKAIPTKTVYLVDIAKKVEPPKELLEKASVDEAIVKIIRQVFLDRIPLYWEKPEKFLPVLLQKTVLDPNSNEQATIRIIETVRYRIPGVPILVRVFKIRLLDLNKYVQINEKLLLDERLTKNPIAISVLDHWLMSDKRETRAVIIEKIYP